jgi:transcriptional regulator with XRE-family HTH domain
MANRQSPLHDASRLGLQLLRETGQELRVARITRGMTQKQVARLMSTSNSWVSRVEHGLIRGIGLPAITRHAAAVGLKPWIRLFPLASRPLDHAQLALFARFRERIGDSWQVVLEAPMPRMSDLRAADVLLVRPGCQCVVELVTRLADLQAQLRNGRLKVRDLGADRLIFVVAGTSANRRMLRAVGPALEAAFPVATRLALERLVAGADPGGDAVVLL